MREPEILIVEIPHRMPPKVYWTTESTLFDDACFQENWEYRVYGGKEIRQAFDGIPEEAEAILAKHGSVLYQCRSSGEFWDSPENDTPAERARFARDALFHDLHSYHEFATVAEAKEHFAKGGHQSFKVRSLLEREEPTPDEYEDEMAATL
jgi:hypothetical protein